MTTVRRQLATSAAILALGALIVLALHTCADTTDAPKPDHERVTALMDRAGCHGTVVARQQWTVAVGRCELPDGLALIAVVDDPEDRELWLDDRLYGDKMPGVGVLGAGWAAVVDPAAVAALRSSLGGVPLSAT